MEGTGVVCLEALRTEENHNNRSNGRRCSGRDSNWGLPNTEHEYCRICGVVTHGNIILVFTTSRPPTSTPHNLMLNIYNSSSALKRNLRTLCNCSNGTRYSHSAYSLMLRTADVVIVYIILVLV